MRRRACGVRGFCNDVALRVLGQTRKDSSARAVARVAWASARLLRHTPGLVESACSHGAALTGHRLRLQTFATFSSYFSRSVICLA